MLFQSSPGVQAGCVGRLGNSNVIAVVVGCRYLKGMRAYKLSVQNEFGVIKQMSLSVEEKGVSVFVTV